MVLARIMNTSTQQTNGSKTMWQDSETEDSAGFADPCGDAVTAFAVAFVVALIAFLTWAYQRGALPLWG